MTNPGANWIDRGRAVGGIAEDVFPDSYLPFCAFRLACVRFQPTGTLIEWNTDHVHPDNLDYVVETMRRWPAPYSLRFFKNAWLQEVHMDAGEAASRVLRLKELDGSLATINEFFHPENPE